MKNIIPKEIKDKNNQIFKSTSYDIRAYVGQCGDFFNKDAVLTPEIMEFTGKITAGFLFKNSEGKDIGLKSGDSFVIGYDNGPTSKILANAFAKGVISQGVDVYDLGVSSSGQVYQNQYQLNAQGYCQITRSHVEVTTNGAKFGIGTQGIHTFLLGQINDAIASESFVPKDCEQGKIIDKKAEGRELYTYKMKRIYEDYFSERDNSNIAINVFGGTGVNYIGLFKDIFGSNVCILGKDLNVNDGDLLADPTRKEMLERVPHMQNALHKGMRVYSFDLDADRGALSFGKNALSLLGKGHYLGDSLAFIIADYKKQVQIPKLISKLQELHIDKSNIDKVIDIAGTLYVDPRYTSSVKTYVENELKLKTCFHRKGHSLWKETMVYNMNTISSLAGFENIADFVKATGYRDIQIEASLHLFSTDAEDGIPRDDAVENIFLTEQILDELNITDLTEYFNNKPARYITKEIRTPSCSNDIKDKVTYKVLSKLKDDFNNKNGFSMVEYDGQLRIDWNTGFIMYGMSNTSPKLTFMAEGETIEERNMALAYLMAVHNSIKLEENDNIPMDINENSMFIKDETYNMKNPDSIDFSNKRVVDFLKFISN